MNQEAKRLWINWLRTAEDKEISQAYGVLCAGDGAYCAMGGFLVANGYQFEQEDGSYIIELEDERVVFCFPSSLALEYELDPYFVANVVAMNDRDHKSFAEIADYIEEND